MTKCVVTSQLNDHFAAEEAFEAKANALRDELMGEYQDDDYEPLIDALLGDELSVDSREQLYKILTVLINHEVTKDIVAECFDEIIEAEVEARL